MISVLLVGNGNVAAHLHTAFLNAPAINVTHISSRDLEIIPQADITIIAVSDDAIAEVSSKIKNHFVVHTSGSVAMNGLKKHHKKGCFLYVTNFL